MSISFLSSSSVLPKRVLTNFDLEKMVDTSDDWIVRMTGIRERHILSEDESYMSCALQAAQQAIAKANLKPQDIDLIVLGTSTASQLIPSTAGMLQGELGINSCVAFDLQAACSGFVYAVACAYHFLNGDPGKKYALVMGCDALSHITDWQDRKTCVLFGDGFGAVVLGKTQQTASRILYCDIGSDGKGKQDLEVPWGIGQGIETLKEKSPYLQMNGREVFKNSVYYFSRLIEQALAKNNITAADLDWVIPHQANLRIIDAVADRVSIPSEKFVVTLDKHGNTSAASIPLAYDWMVQSGKLKPGQLVLLVGFGAGYTWGVVLVRV